MTEKVLRSRDDEAFTFIELAVVLVVVGALAVFTIRVFLSQGGAGYSRTVDLANGEVQPASGPSADLGDVDSWCASLTDPIGSVKVFNNTATNGFPMGTC